ncbi:MAG: hypothetical protein L0J18_12955 [Tetragenococcus koreensis]|nr:hypothetical protein [Tetragenococcus koreensis]
MYKVIWIDDFVGEIYEQEFETKEEAKNYVKEEIIQDPDFFHEIEESDVIELGMLEYIEVKKV